MGIQRGKCGKGKTVGDSSSLSAGSGFSLIEVMIALGVVVFALVALCGLLSTGLQVARKAKTEFFAAQIASSLLAERRAAPLATLPAGHPLPSMTNSNSVATMRKETLDRTGKITTGADAYYSMYYQIVPSDEGVSRVFLALVHPPQSSTGYAAVSQGEENYEITTYIRYK